MCCFPSQACAALALPSWAGLSSNPGLSSHSLLATPMSHLLDLTLKLCQTKQDPSDLALRSMALELFYSRHTPGSHQHLTNWCLELKNDLGVWERGSVTSPGPNFQTKVKTGWAPQATRKALYLYGRKSKEAEPSLCRIPHSVRMQGEARSCFLALVSPSVSTEVTTPR